MPSRKQSTPTDPSQGDPKHGRPVHVMVVDEDNQTAGKVTQYVPTGRIEVVQVSSIAEAFKHLNTQRVDLALIEATLPDGSGLALAKRMRTGYAQTHAIIMTNKPSLDRAVEAMRVGVVDIISKPLDPDEVRQRIDQAIAVWHADQEKHKQIKRLRRVCKKLNRAREEIAQQVDILCNDLVIAYQELAKQVQLLSQTSEFTGLVRQELDLEMVLRHTLEYLLQKAGPTNAAIFLPSDTEPGEYSLGGYVNYECSSESAEILLQHLADELAPKMVQYQWPVHITENNVLTQWLGGEVSFLTDCHLLAVPCQHETETLAVIVLFRHHNQPFDGALVQTCTSIAPTLAEALARVVNIYHRLETDADDQGLLPG